MSCTPNDPTAPNFLTQFQAVEDPHQEGKVLYPLEEILLLVLCGVISGADGWTSIALYGQKKLELLRRFLPYENGTPSHDQLGILFCGKACNIGPLEEDSATKFDPLPLVLRFRGIDRKRFSVKLLLSKRSVSQDDLHRIVWVSMQDFPTL